MFRIFVLLLVVLAMATVSALPSSNLRGYGSYGPEWLRQMWRPRENMFNEGNEMARFVD